MSIKRILALAIACAMLFAGMAVSAMAEAADGVYTGVGQGNHGDVVVETTIEGGVITAVNVTEQIENPDVAGKALVDISAAIVANNAYNVDTVTGATVTSTAIETAVAQAIEAAGGNLADYEMKAAEAVEGETVKLSCDTVVVGAGAAGTFTIQEVWRDWMDYNCWLCDGTLFYNLFKDSGRTVDWLEENGMAFDFMGNEQAAHVEGFPTYHIYADQKNKMGEYLALLDSFTNAGGTCYLETAAYELKAENDAITGVLCRQADGTILDIDCTSVCLCTGGFAANSDMVEAEVGFHLETFTTGTQTGDGARMSQTIGAGKGKTIQQLHGVTSFSGIQTGSGMDDIAKAIYLPNCIWVNTRGSRFCPEDLNYDAALSSNSTFNQGEYYYAIISQEMAANLQESGAQVYGVDTEVRYEPTVPLFSVTEGWAGFVDALEDGCEKGIVFKGDTAEELAEAMGVDANILSLTQCH